MIIKKRHAKYDDKRTCIMIYHVINETTTIFNQMQTKGMASKYAVCWSSFDICSNTVMKMKTWAHICTMFLVIPSLVLLVNSVACRDLFCNYLNAESVMILLFYVITIVLMLVKIIFLLPLCFLWFSICLWLWKHFQLQF